MTLTTKHAVVVTLGVLLLGVVVWRLGGGGGSTASISEGEVPQNNALSPRPTSDGEQDPSEHASSGDESGGTEVAALENCRRRPPSVADKDATGARRKLLPRLIDSLRDTSSEARARAAEALGQMGPAAMDAAPCLRNRLSDESRRVRIQSALALALIDDRERVNCGTVLTEAFSGATGDERWLVVWALGRAGFCGSAEVSLLVGALESDQSPAVRAMAAETLGALKDATDEILAALTASLRDGDWRVRLAAVRAFCGQGLGFGGAVPALVKMLSEARRGHRDALLRESAARALGRTPDTHGVKTRALIMALSDDRPAVRAQAALSLGELGREAHLAASSLVGLLKDSRVVILSLEGSEVEVREAAAESLGRIGVAEGFVIEALTGLASEKGGRVQTRRAATRALERLADR
jgi:HEAT repeat protein